MYVSMYSALHWQKEATHKSPKSEKVMFLDRTLAYSTSIPSLEAETLILLRDI